MNLIKESIDIIILLLTCIINLNIASGIVPKQLKISPVIPIFKAGEKDIFTNLTDPSRFYQNSLRSPRESNVQSSLKVS